MGTNSDSTTCLSHLLLSISYCGKQVEKESRRKRGGELRVRASEESSSESGILMT
jgi:hypothetical protein